MWSNNMDLSINGEIGASIYEGRLFMPDEGENQLRIIQEVHDWEPFYTGTVTLDEQGEGSFLCDSVLSLPMFFSGSIDGDSAAGNSWLDVESKTWGSFYTDSNNINVMDMGGGTYAAEGPEGEHDLDIVYRIPSRRTIFSGTVEAVADEEWGASAEIQLSEPLYAGMCYMVTKDGVEDITWCNPQGFESMLLFGIATVEDQPTLFHTSEPGTYEVKVEVLH